MRSGHARRVPLARASSAARRQRGTPGGRHQQVQAGEDHEHTRRLRTVRTFSPKDSDITRRWHVIDASDVVLGRLASQVAVLLRGKHKPIFAPHVDTGDFVIVVNAAKVALSGSKLEQKNAYRHSGYPGGLRSVSYASLMASHPERVVEKAVKGMLPKNALGRKTLRKLKVYPGPDHPHQAQQPQPFEITQIQQ
jgi:large subunit ribosomal protein L13